MARLRVLFLYEKDTARWSFVDVLGLEPRTDRL